MSLITLPEPVEIDECHIGARVKGAHGRLPAPGRVVFGIKCRTTGLPLIFTIQNKEKSTLLPIIQDHVNEGATVISDKFSSYISRNNNSHIDEIGFNHYFINHSLQFIFTEFYSYEQYRKNMEISSCLDLTCKKQSF